MYITVHSSVLPVTGQVATKVYPFSFQGCRRWPCGGRPFFPPAPRTGRSMRCFLGRLGSCGSWLDQGVSFESLPSSFVWTSPESGGWSKTWTRLLFSLLHGKTTCFTFADSPDGRFKLILDNTADMESNLIRLVAIKSVSLPVIQCHNTALPFLLLSNSVSLP